MSLWRANSNVSRIAIALEKHSPEQVRDLFPTGIRSLSSVRTETFDDATWESLLVPAGANYPPTDRLRSELAAVGAHEVLASVVSHDSTDWVALKLILEAVERAGVSHYWNAAIWDVLGPPLEPASHARFLAIQDRSCYGAAYDYQLAIADNGDSELSKKLDTFDRYPSFLWNGDESVYIECQPYTMWIDLYCSEQSIVDHIVESSGLELVPLYPATSSSSEPPR